ncbi:hypothetical protein NECAME_11694 [Necator americanus]|uniref:Uncharacterized protein n=1 Tax=Necator americanus TaxID=51031 RepID=W2T3E1_NECAM|nr:hypothetical protein NECAME_11694 [Necator americanus]ETN76413.1 hypothetical protein NECAME_11694 [Necator americanus]
MIDSDALSPHKLTSDYKELSCKTVTDIVTTSDGVQCFSSKAEVPILNVTQLPFESGTYPTAQITNLKALQPRAPCYSVAVTGSVP